MHILIADDHDLLRDTLALWFRQDATEVSLAGDLPGALKAMAAAIRQSQPFDLVLLDYGMPGMNGLAGLERALSACEGGRVALMSGIAPRDVAQRALDIGAAGFLPKSMPAKKFVNAVRFIVSGETYAPLDILTSSDKAAARHPMTQNLTPREMEVLHFICEGCTNKEIARKLGLQEPTIKLHVTSLYRKIGARNRTHAALMARETGLF